MNIQLGEADAGVSISISVLNDYLVELRRIGKIPQEIVLQREIANVDVDVKVILDPPVFEMAKPENAQPYTRLILTGTIEVRPSALPNTPPIVFDLDAAVKISLVLVPDEEGFLDVGLQYDGVDGAPSAPISEEDLDELFTTGDVGATLNNIRISIAKTLVQGLNDSRFINPNTRPDAIDWSVDLQLMSAGPDTADAFLVSAAPPGSSATPALLESFVPPRTGMAFAYNRNFLDLMLDRGATAQEDTEEDDRRVERLEMAMTDTAIGVAGHVIRIVDTPVVDIAPDVDIRFDGPMIPSLIRGTTGMVFDTSGINVDVDPEDEILYGMLKWFFTIGASALLFTGVGSLTALGIVLWITLVQNLWQADAEFENAANTVRDSLATALGAQLGLLAESLDDDTDVGELRIDATPDSLQVVDGNMIFLAQILVVPIEMGMFSAEYSKELRRFVIFQLNDGRRFRAQELARLMRAGKVTVPGFHEVAENYLRANPDDLDANNLLEQFKTNETTEVVVNSKRT